MSGGLVIGLSQTVVACWSAILSGLLVAGAAWIAVLGGRAARRQRESGRSLVAALLVVAIVAWLVVALAGVAYGLAAVIPQ